MDSVRLSGLVSYLPSQGLDDGPVFILVGFSLLTREYPVDKYVYVFLYKNFSLKLFWTTINYRSLVGIRMSWTRRH
jgi:hypothetical protein